MMERLPRAVGAHLVGHDVGERVVDRIDQRMHGRIIGVDRRREARVEHAAFARRDGEGAQQALADEGVRDRSARSGNRRRPPAPAAGAHWPGPLVWSAEPREIEMDAVALLLDDDMDAHRLFQIDAVVVDEALGLEAAVLPFGEGLAQLRFRQFEQAVEAGEDFLLADISPRARSAAARRAGRRRAGRGCRRAPVRACGCWRR